MTFHEKMDKRITYANDVLQNYAMVCEEGYQKSVLEAMNYSLMAGGKRLRPILMQSTYELFGGTGTLIEPFMAAIELIHTYSLVHDDLPAMDNDEYRRGKKTTHVVYGEAMAILAGDGLLTHAFSTAAKAFDLCREEELIAVAKAMKVLADYAGIAGMVGGQAVDVEAEKKNIMLDEQKLLYIFELKTGALIQASMMIGAILAGATEEQILSVSDIAKNVGIAFQIQDDILDATSSLEVLGKPVGSDEKNNKTTYVTIKGLEQAKEDVKRYSEAARETLAMLPVKSEFLSELIESLITREK